MNDNDIINYFWEGKCYIKKNKLQNIPENILYYLNNRYKDSLSILETINRIKQNINIHPICPICHKNLVVYKGTGGNKNIFQCTCSDKNCQDTYKTIKIKQTKLERYGDENYNNIEQTIKNTDYIKRQEKINKTKLEKYGSLSYHNIEKMEKTCLERYGIKNGGGSKQSIKKIKQTKLERYGNEKYCNINKIKQLWDNKSIEEINRIIEKRKQTCLNLYNVDSYTKSKQYKELISNKEFQEKRKQNEYKTKKINNSFNISRDENKIYRLLKEKYSDIIKQYNSEKYPFNCDFYIPSLDLYIEYNGHWTHGKKPYEGTKEDLDKINRWKNKNTEYYNRAIVLWTQRDVYKRNIAKQNNLNYIEFFNYNDFYKWYEKLHIGECKKENKTLSI